MVARHVVVVLAVEATVTATTIVEVDIRHAAVVMTTVEVLAMMTTIDAVTEEADVNEMKVTAAVALIDTRADGMRGTAAAEIDVATTTVVKSAAIPLRATKLLVNTLAVESTLVKIVMPAGKRTRTGLGFCTLSLRQIVEFRPPRH